MGKLELRPPLNPGSRRAAHLRGRAWEAEPSPSHLPGWGRVQAGKATQKWAPGRPEGVQAFYTALSHGSPHLPLKTEPQSNQASQTTREDKLPEGRTPASDLPGGAPTPAALAAWLRSRTLDATVPPRMPGTLTPALLEQGQGSGRTLHTNRQPTRALRHWLALPACALSVIGHQASRGQRQFLGAPGLVFSLPSLRHSKLPAGGQEASSRQRP